MPNLTERAEKALLGAMLLGAGRGAVTPRLKREDFADETHRALLTMIEQASSGPADRTSADGTSPVSREYLNEVKQACPDPDHAPAYARMVIEAGLRRHLLAHALRLEYAAGDLHHHARRLAEVTSPGGTADDLLKRTLRTPTGHAEPSVERLLSHELLVSLALRAHVRAFDPDTQSASPDPPAGPGTGSPPAMSPASPAGAAGRTAALPSPQPQDAATEREECVLASIIRQDHETSDIPRWLPAEAFTGTARRELYTAITRLHARGEPVDKLTADWERARHQALATGTADTDSGYAARLARHRADPAAALRAAHELSGAYSNPPHDRGAVQRLTREQLTIRQIQPATGIPRPAPGTGPASVPLLPPSPDPPGEPGHGPRA